MGTKEKLLDKAKQSATNFKFKDLVKLAKYHGFQERHQKGSHLMMKHSTHDIFLNFQNRKGEAKPYQVKQLLIAIEDHNL